MPKNDALATAVAFLSGYGKIMYDQKYADNMQHAADLLTEQAGEIERLNRLRRGSDQELDALVRAVSSMGDYFTTDRRLEPMHVWVSRASVLGAAAQELERLSAENSRLETEAHDLELRECSCGNLALQIRKYGKAMEASCLVHEWELVNEIFPPPRKDWADATLEQLIECLEAGPFTSEEKDYPQAGELHRHAAIELKRLQGEVKRLRNPGPAECPKHGGAIETEMVRCYIEHPDPCYGDEMPRCPRSNSGVEARFAEPPNE